MKLTTNLNCCRILKKLSTRGFPSIILLAFSFNLALGQSQIKLWISWTDALGDTAIGYFGIDTRATYCIDTSLGEHGVWWQACNFFPVLSFRGARGGVLGPECYEFANGTTIDFRPYYSPSQIDTYRVDFCNYDPPLIFQWQSDIAQYYGAMTFMNHKDTAQATVKIDMLTEQSYKFSPGDDYLNWYIRAEAPRLPTGVPKQDNSMPKEAVLQQNYPNPFNPTTEIKYGLPFEAKVQLTVYNVLGEAIAFLKNDIQQAGFHTIQWNASGIASGIYFYRLEATSVTNPTRSFTNVKKMALVK